MILSCQNIEKAFLEKQVLKNCSFHIEDYEKAAIVGINGAGKPTLLKIIVGELSADQGDAVLSKGKTLGYLAQHQDLTSHKTIYEELLEVKRPIIEMEEKIRSLEVQMKHVTGAELDQMLDTYTRLNHEFELANGYSYQSEITGVLKGLGFAEEDFTKEISTLSGGQKTRVSLGKLLLSRPDIIMLDEPTNHLDMESISWLETYLMNYKGAVIIVAHDRYFLDNVVDRIFELDGKGGIRQYEGGYSDYLNAKRQQEESAAMVSKIKTGSSTGKGENKKGEETATEENKEEKASKKTWKQNRQEKVKFTYKEQREYETIDEDIAKLEEKLASIERQITANATNSVKLRELMEKQENCATELEEKEERWMYLNELAEQMGL